MCPECDGGEEIISSNKRFAEEIYEFQFSRVKENCIIIGSYGKYGVVPEAEFGEENGVTDTTSDCIMSINCALSL